MVLPEITDENREDYGELEELENELKHNFVHFTFYKKDGTLRDSYGTRQPTCLISVDAPLPRMQNTRYILPFYDAVAQGWRCISLNNNHRPQIKVLEVFKTFDEMQQAHPEIF